MAIAGLSQWWLQAWVKTDLFPMIEDLSNTPMSAVPLQLDPGDLGHCGSMLR